MLDTLLLEAVFSQSDGIRWYGLLESLPRVELTGPH